MLVSALKMWVRGTGVPHENKYLDALRGIYSRAFDRVADATAFAGLLCDLGARYNLDIRTFAAIGQCCCHRDDRVAFVAEQ